MAPIVFPSPNSYGQNVPAQAASPEIRRQATTGGELINLLLLADLALYEKPDDIRDCAGRLLERAESISDPALRRLVVFSLSKIINAPENAENSRREHMTKIGQHFFDVAAAARKGNRNEDALAAVQIALKCAPANAEARLLFASLIEPKAALQTLHYGIQFLDLKTEIAPAYFNRYFGALADLQQDRIAAKQALALLGGKTEDGAPALPSAVRTVVANHAAMALFWLGEYSAALRIIEDEKIGETQQGLILKSRCLFDLRRSREAIALLGSKVNDFPASKRDVILSQLAHFHQYLGDLNAALETTNRRIEENPTAPQPYLHRLYLLDKLGKKEAFDEEIAAIFKTFSAQQSALISLANFSAENGNPAIAETCAALAVEKKFPPNIFVAAMIEACITAKMPERAIDTYQKISKSSPKMFDGVESASTAILAAAYTLAAEKAGDDAENRARFESHAELLLGQFLADATLSAENYISVSALFMRIGQNETALKIAQAGLAAFPWHAQLRANVVSLRIACKQIAGTRKQTPLEKEIRVLAAMRRPNPKVWSDIAQWLATTDALPQNEIAALQKIVSPLVRNDLSLETMRGF